MKHKGIWTITDAGVEAYRRFADPEEFYREAVRLYRKWKATQPIETEDSEESEDDEAEKSASITYEEAEGRHGPKLKLICRI